MFFHEIITQVSRTLYKHGFTIKISWIIDDIIIIIQVLRFKNTNTVTIRTIRFKKNISIRQPHCNGTLPNIITRMHVALYVLRRSNSLLTEFKGCLLVNSFIIYLWNNIFKSHKVSQMLLRMIALLIIISL